MVDMACRALLRQRRWQPTNEHLVRHLPENYAGPENVYKALIGEKPWHDPEIRRIINLLTERTCK